MLRTIWQASTNLTSNQLDSASRTAVSYHSSPSSRVYRHHTCPWPMSSWLAPPSGLPCSISVLQQHWQFHWHCTALPPSISVAVHCTFLGLTQGIDTTKSIATTMSLQTLMQCNAMQCKLMAYMQVMAEAADLCAHTLVHHCRSPRLLKPIADALCTDKNVKLRHFCAKYMLQV